MHENSRCKAVDPTGVQEIVSHSQVCVSRRERVCLVLAIISESSEWIHGMYRQSVISKMRLGQRVCIQFA